MQSYRPKSEQQNFFPMQSEFTAVVEDGGAAAQLFIDGKGSVREFSVQYERENFGLRTGRFLPPFGLRDPNHMLSTRKVWKETDQVVGYYQTRKYGVYASSYPVLRFEGYLPKTIIVASFSLDYRSVGLLFSPLPRTHVMLEAANYASYAKIGYEVLKGLEVFSFLDSNTPGIGARISVISNIEFHLWATQNLMFVVGGFSL